MKPLVSINIPTYNSEKTLEATLNSVFAQDYKNIEIIIIDSYSKDNTLKVAKKFKSRVLMCKGGLLESRILGGRKSKGKYVLLLDSDQILEKTAISRAVNLMKKYDCLWFYERSFNKHKFIPSLYDADRIITQEYFNPDEDIVLPRFFDRKLLMRAWNNIPEEYIPLCGSQDHISTWNEFRRISKKGIGRVDSAVWHMEPENLRRLIKKQFRWGKTTRDVYKFEYYHKLIKKKYSFRIFRIKHPILSLKSFLLRILRGIPYFLGMLFG